MNYRLTTEHPAGSPGLPMLVDDDGQANGPMDMLSHGEYAWQFVVHHLPNDPQAERFLSQVPDAQTTRALPIGWAKDDPTMSARFSDPEHRKRTRWPVNHYLQVFPKDSASPLGHVADIHLDGLRLVSPKSIPLGAHLPLWLELPLETGERQRVLLDIQSVWFHTPKRADFWETGCCITDATPEAIEGVQRLVEHLRTSWGVQSA